MTIEICSFTIPGYCQPKQRTFGRSFVTPPQTRAYENTVRRLARLAMGSKPPTGSFIGLSVEIIHSVPKSWSLKKKNFALTGKLFPTNCDCSNQLKSLEDGMNRIVYEDDRLINHLTVRREYGLADQATVTVYGLEKPDKLLDEK